MYIDKTLRQGKNVKIFTKGPYSIFPHPLYIGNLFITAGMLILLNPQNYIKYAILFAFILMYSFFSIYESNYLKKRFLEYRSYLKNIPYFDRKQWQTYSFSGVKEEINTFVYLIIIIIISFFV